MSPMSNRLREKLPEIRAALKPDPRFDDYYLLRFLRARKGDVPAAISMLKDHFAWRKAQQIDQLYYDQLDHPTFLEEEQLCKVYPSGYWGLDNHGRVIYYERLGMTDWKSVLRVCSKERFLQYFIYQYERLIWTRFPACRPPDAGPDYRDQSLTFIDLRGLSWDHIGPTSRLLFREIVALASKNYPEIMGRTFVLNAPKIFSIGWLAVKNFVDPETREKISILPPGHKTNDAIDQYVRHEVLPDFLGGRVRGVCGVVDFGPWQEHPALVRPPACGHMYRSPTEDSFVSCIDDEAPTAVSCWACSGFWS